MVARHVQFLGYHYESERMHWEVLSPLAALEGVFAGRTFNDHRIRHMSAHRRSDCELRVVMGICHPGKRQVVPAMTCEGKFTNKRVHTRAVYSQYTGLHLVLRVAQLGGSER